MDPTLVKRLSARIVSAAMSVALAGGLLFADGGTIHVTGTVTDGSGHGWPLYARIAITSASTEPVVVFSDPVTGNYATDLESGIAYTFAVTAVGPGYVPGGGPITTAGSPVVADWSLLVAPTCDAPGYAPGNFGPLALNEGFDAGVLPPGWAVDTASGFASWQVTPGADPDPCLEFPGNETGGSGSYAIINSACFGDFFTPDDSSLVTRSVDLSTGANAAIHWANDYRDFDSTADVDVSTDGGTTWTNIWERSGVSQLGPGTQMVDMSFAAGQANVKVRFHFVGLFAGWWQVDNVQIGPFTCTPLSGGLVVGKVSDAKTDLGLNGATVLNLPAGDSTTTFATPEDPNQGDGFYILFAGSGSQPIEASLSPYNPLTKNMTVVPNVTVSLDFSLTAGLLDASPRPLSAIVNPGGSQDLTLTVSSTATGERSFVLHEVNVPPSSQALTAGSAAFANAPARYAALTSLSLGRLGATDMKDLSPPPNTLTNVPVSAGAGNVISSFAPTGFMGGFGLAYDTDANRLWISNSDAPRAGFNGDGLDYQYRPNGTPTGETIDLHGTASAWQGDGTYNARTGMIWQTNVGFRRVIRGDDCLFEIDPVVKAVTGKQICGPWGDITQTGLAYDYATDTYYVGGAFGVITHIDSAGNLLDSGKVDDLQISGLAYNPTTGHLFVGTRNIPFDIYVVDPRNDYFPISGFAVTSGGVNVLNAQGASLEADCGGHLWVYNFNEQRVFEFESGENGWCVDNIPWLSEDPTSGTIPGSGGGARLTGGGNSQAVTVTFDSQSLLPGLRQGSLVFTTDPPNPVAPVAVNLTVRFLDVAANDPAGTDPYENYIYGAAGAGVMPGCAPYPPASSFCPSDIVTRRSMAGFIERAVHGALTPPPVYLGKFADVQLGSFNADYIQGLVNDGITAGCGVAPPRYCPDSPVTRGQMAVFVWKGQHGATPPPSCTNVFGDVACPPTPQAPFGDYIQGIYDEGVTVGCGSGNYCPDAGIPNEQMAVFLVRAFNVPFLAVP